MDIDSVSTAVVAAPRRRPLTDAEWEQQRENITYLYRTRNLKLAEVISTMEQQYGFRAGRRQYLRRINQWKLFKNVKAHEKDELIKLIFDNNPKKSSQTQFPVHDRRLDPNLAQRLHRHMRSSGRRLVHERGGGDWNGRDSRSCIQDNKASNAVREVSSFGLSERTRCMEHLQIWAVSPRPSVDMLSTSETIFLSTRNLVESSEHSPLGSNLIEQTSSSQQPRIFDDTVVMEALWTDVQNSIYMLKTQRSPSAWQFIHRACNALSTSTHFGLLTLKHIYSTLSPENLTTYSQIGEQIIRYIAEVMQLRNGNQVVNHPLYHICSALLKSSATVEVYTQGLEIMLQNLCQSPENRNQRVRLQVQRGLIKTYRRSGDYRRAHDLCTQQIETAIGHFGQESREARAAKRELVHVLSQSGRSEEAIVLCEEIIFGFGQDVKRPFLDDQTVWALEDLAEYHQKIGDMLSYGLLLQEAYRIAVQLWTNDSSSSTCIAEKIAALEASRIAQNNALERTSRFISLLNTGT